MAAERKLTMTVPEAGAHFFGLKKRASYDAADRGDLITIRVGRYRIVPVAAQEARIQTLVDRAIAERDGKAA